MAVASHQRPGGNPSGSLLLFSIFFISFGLLTVYSVSPTVYAGDSSLFTAAAYHMGSAHPPAYPLLLLLGKFSTFLPLGNIAFRVNLLSAVFGALTALMAYKASHYITGDRAVSLLAPLIVLASPNLILESSKAESYSLNTFLIMLLFYLGLRAIRERRCFKEILLFSFVMGLGMGNHHTIGFMLLPLLIVFASRVKDLPTGTLPLGIVFFFAGFSVNFYLFLRSITETHINYSMVYDFYDFLSIFLRTGYSSGSVEAIRELASSGSPWVYAVKNLAFLAQREVQPLVWLLLLAGIAGLFREKRVLLYLLCTLLIWLPLARLAAGGELSTDHTSIVSPYFLQLVPLVGVSAAMGLFKIFKLIDVRSRLVSRAIVAGLMVLQAGYAAGAIQKSSLSDYYISYTWIKDISKVIRPKSFYLVFGDNPAFLNFYGQGVERLRDDVLFLDALPAGKTFRTTVSPGWKYGRWYPEFYEEELVSVKYFLRLAKDKRLFSSGIEDLPSILKNRLDVKGHVLTYIALPMNNSYPYNERFREDFKKIDYLPVVIGHKKDLLTSEINNQYANTIRKYAKILAEEGSDDADYHFKLAYFIANNSNKYKILLDYITFLYARDGEDEARKYTGEILKDSPAEDREKLAIGLRELLDRLGNTQRRHLPERGKEKTPRPLQEDDKPANVKDISD